MTKYNHPFHLVTQSPWPLLISLELMNLLISTVNWFNECDDFSCVTFNFLCTMLISIQWWRDVIRESTFQGFHTFFVYINMRLGMILFIISEIFFFLSFFWAYFHSSLAPSLEIGQLWPPLGIKPFNPLDIPLLNTIILISSGLTVTWTHHSILQNNFKESKISLLMTIMLGIFFTSLQLIEYMESPFTIADSIYGSTFFVATGFHGLHVIIGTLFLYISFARMINLHFSKIHHFSFEGATWYWHFVDVVWLFLYMSIYWWSF
uniref:cytochrome c oxidase subunit III n=1 Tax=Paraponera clavata TaxID=55425 RepID=UPI002A82598A|nr:cytochrome c oxidase subunit III [Paraponera clavata]WNO15837.1 cytochrome c oxidase subunit III [Paraponera clavata]